MRTPGILIFGMVLAPCGWVLDLTSTVAPNWRTINSVDGASPDVILNQGIWDICRTSTTSREVLCNQPSNGYLEEQIITVAQGMMVASLIVTLIGIAVATPGVRCWTDRPNWTIAGLGGLLIFCSGVLTIIPIAWYTHILTNITGAQGTDIRVGYCIILGYIGGILEVLGGFVMFIGICRCCGGRNRGEKPQKNAAKTTRNRSPLRRITVPSVTRSVSRASSVPYSKDSLDDEIDFPRAKSQGNRSVNSSYSGRPYDADL
ncbi:claudin-23-like [Chanos chanos]|uniref:Claudin-23-like n=1 Tax=Chanos chanos TaxID=29144 RepID=A0A6J2UU34_CHACN|nr:claudin-23-like [Chanos chanos]XP_030623263.1 claudin-23-like [Chanos chanos]